MHLLETGRCRLYRPRRLRPISSRRACRHRYATGARRFLFALYRHYCDSTQGILQLRFELIYSQTADGRRHATMWLLLWGTRRGTCIVSGTRWNLLPTHAGHGDSGRAWGSQQAGRIGVAPHVSARDLHRLVEGEPLRTARTLVAAQTDVLCRETGDCARLLLMTWWIWQRHLSHRALAPGRCHRRQLPAADAGSSCSSTSMAHAGDSVPRG